MTGSERGLDADEVGPVGRYRYSANPRPEVQQQLPSSFRRLLDVGCAFGDFGVAAKRLQPEAEVWGIDSAAAVAEVATSRLDRFVPGLFPSDLPPSTFDCITFNDALEHFEDPWMALEQVRAHLEEDGRLIVTLPNVRHYSVVRQLVVNGRWDYADSGILDRTHLRFFTRTSAESMFRECGYEVERVVPVNLTAVGRASRVLSALGSRCVEFRAVQFVFVMRDAKTARRGPSRGDR